MNEATATLGTKLGRRNRTDVVADTLHKWVLHSDAAGEWSAKHVEVQAPLVNAWPVVVKAQRGTHPAHIATALRALADHVESHGVPGLTPHRPL